MATHPSCGGEHYVDPLAGGEGELLSSMHAVYRFCCVQSALTQTAGCVIMTIQSAEGLAVDRESIKAFRDIQAVVRAVRNTRAGSGH